MTSPELPEWFGGVAVGETVSAPLVILVALAANALPPEDPPEFLAGLVRQGVLIRDGVDLSGRTFRLLPDVHSSMVTAMSQMPGGVIGVRQRLIRQGLVSTPISLLGQLALWASQNSDWASLTELWLKYPPAVWASVAPKSLTVFSAVPTAALKDYPALSQAEALTAGMNGPTALTLSEQAVRRIRQDGRLLHEGWRSLKSVDSAVRAGTMWMVAQRTLAGSPNDLDDAWITYQELKAFIHDQSHAGNPPAPQPQVFFHAMSAETAFLRGDLASARSEAEEAMNQSQPGDIAALIGAGLQALTQAFIGDVRGFEAAANWYAAHSLACGSFAAIAAPYLEVARALLAIRLLDRDSAEASLQASSAMQQRSELWSVHAWVASLNDLTWQEADFGLARLEVAVSRNPLAVAQDGLIDTFETRARAELLCGAGRVNQDNALLRARTRSKLIKYHLVAEARMHLCGQDGASAVRVAEHGIHDATFPLSDRAHLCTIKAAGLLATAAETHLIQEALHAACTLCTEAANLLPFVFLPADLRAGLLRLHDDTEPNPNCLLSKPELRMRLDHVQNNFQYSPALIRLTPREEILLPLLATPATIDAIARELHVSVNTVRKQVVTLRVKLGESSRPRMIDRAYQLGLLAEH
jgi:DNA-binding NarL/FixJ family response regulator